MSPLDTDSLFAHPYSLLSSDFANSTELDVSSKDMFLINGMETIDEHELLQELDLQGVKKPLFKSQVSDDAFVVSLSENNGDDMDYSNAFGVSLRGTDDDVMDSTNARCSPFTMLLNREPAEQLELMTLQMLDMDTPPASDVLDIEVMELPSSIPSHKFAGGGPPSQKGLLAVNKMDCVCLNDLDLAELNVSNPLSSPPHGAAGSQPSRKDSAHSPASLLPPVKRSSVRTEMGHSSSLFSIDTLSPTLLQISSPLSSPSSPTTFQTLADGSFFNVLYGHDDGSNIHGFTERLTQPAQNLGVLMKSSCLSNNPSHNVDTLVGVSVNAPHIMGTEASHNPSMQRSQSSHALGELRLPSCLGSGKNESGTPAMWKPETVTSTNLYQFGPFGASKSTGITGSSTITPMRRVFSMGDLQKFSGGNLENTIREEGTGLKIGNCTVEERKMKLHRYRQKRTERNFSKKIKYVCRKTLADRRPRVRGRFARSDEFGDSTANGSDLPLIDEYEEVSSVRPWTIPDVAYVVPNNNCTMPMPDNQIPQFWRVVGMRVGI